jgi:hypothetical protein
VRAQQCRSGAVHELRSLREVVHCTCMVLGRLHSWQLAAPVPECLLLLGSAGALCVFTVSQPLDVQSSCCNTELHGALIVRWGLRASDGAVPAANSRAER